MPIEQFVCILLQYFIVKSLFGKLNKLRVPHINIINCISFSQQNDCTLSFRIIRSVWCRLTVIIWHSEDIKCRWEKSEQKEQWGEGYSQHGSVSLTWATRCCPSPHLLVKKQPQEPSIPTPSHCPHRILLCDWKPFSKHRCPFCCLLRWEVNQSSGASSPPENTPNW